MFFGQYLSYLIFSRSRLKCCILCVYYNHNCAKIGEYDLENISGQTVLQILLLILAILAEIAYQRTMIYTLQSF